MKCLYLESRNGSISRHCKQGEIDTKFVTEFITNVNFEISQLIYILQAIILNLI